VNRAPPSGRFETAIRPVVEVDDRLGDREAEAGSARGCPAPARTVEDLRHVLGADAGPSSSTSTVTSRRSPRTADEDRSAARRMADRVVDEDHDQLAQAGLVAADHRRLGIEAERHAAIAGELHERPRALGRDFAEVDRQAVERDRPGVRAGEEQQVVHERGQETDLDVDVVERLGRRLRLAGGTGGDARRSSGSPSAESEARGSRRGRTPAAVGGAARCKSSDSRIGTSARRA
jgi:hypothetical protein